MFGLGRRKPLDPKTLTDVSSLAALSSRQLRGLGRLTEPLLRRSGESGFLVASWDEALDRIAADLRTVDPARAAFYLTSHGLTNEVYYAAQKAARFLGTNHVDISARPCDAASTSAMTMALGHAASTCSYSDWLHADLIVLFGSDVANSQPVSGQSLHRAKANGAQIEVVDGFRASEVERYRLASIAKGNLAFLVGVLRALIEEGGVDETFVRERTTGFENARARALGSEWPTLEADSGSTREQMAALARLLVARPNAVLMWSAELAQHAHGVETIGALIDVGLARGLPGHPNRGLVPIYGDAGALGAADVGCVPTLDDASAARFAEVWEFPSPAASGWTATDMIEHAADGDVDLLWIVGADVLEALPDVARSRGALAQPKLRIHQDIVLSSSLLADCGGDVLILPAATRYESEGGGTETSTERRIVFSPEIPGRRLGSARPDWWVFGEAMARARPNRANYVRFDSAAAIRAEIARAVPRYAGIETLTQKGDEVQWGGRTLYAEGRFATPDGLAHFAPVSAGERTSFTPHQRARMS